MRRSLACALAWSCVTATALMQPVVVRAASNATAVSPPIIIAQLVPYDDTRIVVPSFIGQNSSTGYNRLAALGFEPTIVYLYSNQPRDEIIDQQPRDEYESRGATITLTVSAGPAPDDTPAGDELYDLPSVVGLTLAEAQGHLQVFEVLVNYVSSSEPVDRVVDQQPPPQQGVPRGTQVILRISDASIVLMPRLRGLTREAALSALERTGDLVAEISEEPSDSAKGLVVRQDPRADKRIRRGSKVNLTVSSGPAQIAVPNVVGKRIDDAMSMLEAFDVHRTEIPDLADAGIITEQSPPPGTTVDPGSTLTLTLSDGSLVRVPELRSMDIAAARELVADGLKLVTSESTTSAPADAGKVLGQSPPANEAVRRGSEVRVMIGKREPELVPVPDVVGLSFEDAQKRLAGFQLQRDELSDAAPSGQVIRQSPPGGTKATPGSEVQVWISAGQEPGLETTPEIPETQGTPGPSASPTTDTASPTPVGPGTDQPGSSRIGTAVQVVTVPPVVDLSERDARSALEQIGLLAEVADGPWRRNARVVQQAPTEGASVALGSSVAITVSKAVPVVFFLAAALTLLLLAAAVAHHYGWPQPDVQLAASVAGPVDLNVSGGELAGPSIGLTARLERIAQPTLIVGSMES